MREVIVGHDDLIASDLLFSESCQLEVDDSLIGNNSSATLGLKVRTEPFLKPDAQYALYLRSQVPPAGFDGEMTMSLLSEDGDSLHVSIVANGQAQQLKEIEARKRRGEALEPQNVDFIKTIARAALTAKIPDAVPPVHQEVDTRRES